MKGQRRMVKKVIFLFSAHTKISFSFFFFALIDVIFLSEMLEKETTRKPIDEYKLNEGFCAYNKFDLDDVLYMLNFK